VSSPLVGGRQQQQQPDSPSTLTPEQKGLKSTSNVQSTSFRLLQRALDQDEEEEESSVAGTMDETAVKGRGKRNT